MTLPKNPTLVPLKHGNPYCEDCHDVLSPPQLVAWWPVRGRRVLNTVVCAVCHRGRVRATSAGRKSARRRTRRS
jgi:hypothetical protein